ncbi:hypothetical protein DSO57_1016099 [Entomophthora muscae]|uniref:Uncharacterized protein n=1 Tax=Entomophthora muscae TaxID=34485 RepID=A0ACC2TSB3_9FUNG|nr:hypothetical protein DSO57_1016099 [Entomophthora muscae]
MKPVVPSRGTFYCACPLSSIRKVLLSVPPFPWCKFPHILLYSCNTIIINTSFVIIVRIDNFSPLELQAQEQESNPEPGFPRAAGPEDRETNRLHFSGIKPLQADVEEDGPPRKVD